MKMKDIVIPSRVVKRELLILLVSFVSSFLLNIFSIIKYKTAWVEVFSQLHVVLAVAVVIYILVAFFRWLSSALLRLFVKRPG
jgi:hypothetical protein